MEALVALLILVFSLLDFFFFFSDTKNWFLSCRSSSGKSCYWYGWSNHLLWFWYDGRNKIFHPGETARTFLCCLWAWYKEGRLSIFKHPHLKRPKSTQWTRILSISLEMEKSHFMVRINVIISNSVNDKQQHACMQVVQSLVDLEVLQSKGDMSSVRAMHAIASNMLNGIGRLLVLFSSIFELQGNWY